MEPSQTRVKGKREVILALLMLAIAPFWMFYLGDRLVTSLQSHWQALFNVPWQEDSEWRFLPIFFAVQFLPAFASLVASWLLISRAERLNAPTLHRKNLAQLTKARDALKQGISSLEIVEKEYTGKLAAFEKLKGDVEALQAAKAIDTEELRRTLNAIEQANRFTRTLQQAAGFVLGVLSSLVASYVWERL
jgi:hypothetical protein